MRWPAYAILVYALLGIQVGASRYIQFHGAAPNFALMGVVFISLNARRNQALMGSFLIGLLQDCLGGGPVGMFAFSYGLVALMVHSARHIIGGANLLTYVAMTAVGALVTLLLVLLQSRIRPPGAFRGTTASTELYRVMYTTAAAVPVLHWLDKIRTVFGFAPHRRPGRH